MKSLASYVLLFLSIALYSHFLNYSLWDLTSGSTYMWIFSIFTVGWSLLIFKEIKMYHDVNKRYLYFLIMWPIFSMIINYICGNGSIESYRTNILMSFAFITYFLYVKCETTEKQIISVMTIMGLVTFFIQVYQQINPNFLLFGIIDYEGDTYSHVRNGIMRFYVGSYFIAVFCMYYYWEKTLVKKSVISFLLFILFFASMYLYMTRQVMVASLITIILSVFFVKEKKILKMYIFFALIVAGLIVMYFDILFKQLIESYQEDTFTTDIRIKAGNFILDQMAENPLGCFFGYGHGRYEYAWASKGFYLSDIGFIGEGFLYGIPWIILYFVVLYKYIIVYRNLLPPYIRLYFVGTFINSIMIFPYRSNIEAFVWLIALYIGGLYINNNNQNSWIQIKN